VAARASCIHSLAQLAHGRQRCETVAAETLHATAFVVDADQQVVAQRLHGGGQFGQLPPVLPVAREQDQPAGQRVGQSAAVVGGQRRAGDVEDHRGMFGHGALGVGSLVSTTTKDAA
jgi:hypothetical protein